MIAPAIALAAVGASALISWRAQYRTTDAQLLWNTCNVLIILYTTAFPLLFIGTLFLSAHYLGGIPELPLLMTVVAAVVAYAMIRCIIVVLSFYAFTGLPEGVYTTEVWVNFVPSFH